MILVRWCKNVSAWRTFIAVIYPLHFIYLKRRLINFYCWSVRLFLLVLRFFTCHWNKKQRKRMWKVPCNKNGQQRLSRNIHELLIVFMSGEFFCSLCLIRTEHAQVYFIKEKLGGKVPCRIYTQWESYILHTFASEYILMDVCCLSLEIFDGCSENFLKNFTAINLITLEMRNKLADFYLKNVFSAPKYW